VTGNQAARLFIHGADSVPTKFGRQIEKIKKANASSPAMMPAPTKSKSAVTRFCSKFTRLEEAPEGRRKSREESNRVARNRAARFLTHSADGVGAIDGTNRFLAHELAWAQEIIVSRNVVCRFVLTLGPFDLCRLNLIEVAATRLCDSALMKGMGTRQNEERAGE
jgi:hypothetical protein